MQTPAGVAFEGGKIVVKDWWHVINNPSWLFRLPHMLSAAYLTGSFLIAGVGAWYLLRRKHIAFARRSIALGMAFASVLIAGQVFIGDLLYGTMLKHQPSKMQAAEGFWEKQSESPAPYYWVIVPDQKQQRNKAAFGVPYLGSIWLTHSLHGRVEGLKNTPREQQPAMGMVFYGFRIMYGIGILMFAIASVSLWLRWRGTLFTTPWFLRLLVAMTPSGIIATLGGWYLAETGRQPWVIFGLLKTVDAVSPVPAKTLLITLIAFIILYAFFMTAFLAFVLRIIRRGPNDAPAQADASGSLKNAFRPEIMNQPVSAMERG